MRPDALRIAHEAQGLPSRLPHDSREPNAGTTGVGELASVITTEMDDEMPLKRDMFNIPATA
jgi:hypothetical protein